MLSLNLASSNSFAEEYLPSLLDETFGSFTQSYTHDISGVGPSGGVLVMIKIVSYELPKSIF